MKKSLDNVVEAGQNFVEISLMHESVMERPYDKALPHNFLGYANRRSDFLKIEDVDEAAGILSRKPTLLKQLIVSSAKRDTERLVDTVAEGYKKIIDDMPENELKGLAAEIPNRNKKFHEIEEKLKAGDYKGAVDAYAETFDSDEWKKSIRKANIEFVVEHAAIYVELEKIKLIDEYKINGENGEFDYEKLRQDIKDTVENCDNREDREKAYLMIGKSYAVAKGPEEFKMAYKAMSEKRKAREQQPRTSRRGRRRGRIAA